jgi:hypothetical protein
MRWMQATFCSTPAAAIPGVHLDNWQDRLMAPGRVAHGYLRTDLFGAVAVRPSGGCAGIVGKHFSTAVDQLGLR